VDFRTFPNALADEEAFRLDGAALHYLSQKGISEDTATNFGLWFVRAGPLQGRIVIPIHNESGLLVGYASRSIDTAHAPYHFPLDFDKSREVFNLHRVLEENDSGRGVLVVAGFLDCMRVWQTGYRSVVAIMGCSLSATQGTLLSRNFKHVALILDSRYVNQVADELQHLSSQLRIQIVALPAKTFPDYLAAALKQVSPS
jgi:DNA primase